MTSSLPTALRPADIAEAARLYGACRRARGPVDSALAKALRESRAADRGFVVDVAQGMLRYALRLEAAIRTSPLTASDEALACLYLVGVRGVPVAQLPLPRADAAALVRAWEQSAHADVPTRTGTPAWLVHALGDDEALLNALLDAPRTTLRTNTLRTTREALLATLRKEGFAVEPARLSDTGIHLRTRAALTHSAAFKDGLFEIQDEGSQLITLLCEAKPGAVVVDGCAGAGGKTLHLACEMNNSGTLHALDVSDHRLQALHKRARRAGVHNLRAESVIDVTKRKKRLEDRADVVLVDAPCSGVGVLRRNPDIRWKLHSGDVDRMVAEQRDILAGYAKLVRPGGRLVFSTCSLFAQENDANAAWFLQQHADFHALSAKDILQRRGVTVDVGVADTMHLDPLHHGTDGFFAAVFERNAS